MSSTEIIREQIISELIDATRRASTGTVLFHHVIADVLGLNPTDHKCADIIILQGPISAGELAEITGLTSGTITAVLDRLEKARFIRRIPDPNDRRKVLLESIPDRHPELEELFSKIGNAHSEMLVNYTDEELKVLLRYAEESIVLVNKQIRDLRADAKQQNTGHK